MAKGFFKGVKSELKKVVWPTKKQLIEWDKKLNLEKK